VSKRGGKEQDRQANSTGYRNTTLEEHLGNLFEAIRIQKHHLIEAKRPRTPPKVPLLGYRTRSLESLRAILKL